MCGVLLPYRSQNAPAPAKTRRNGRARAGQGRCAWCNRKLRGHQQSACSSSCRSQLSRCKHRTAVRALTQIGMPRHVADRLIAAVGLPEVETKLVALGWRWQPADRAWIQTKESGRILLKGAA